MNDVANKLTYQKLKKTISFIFSSVCFLLEKKLEQIKPSPIKLFFLQQMNVSCPHGVRACMIGRCLDQTCSRVSFEYT